jgi:hypothetical protein
MTLELTTAGLSTMTQAELVEELVVILRAAFGANLRVDAKSIMGQLVNIFSEGRAVDHQVLLAVYRSFDPNGAIGAALDARCALTGTIRKGATNSVVTGTLTWTGAGTINPGALIRNTDNDTLWSLTSGPHSVVGAGTTSNVEFTAVATGPILANSGTTWANVTTVIGLAIPGFTNPSDDAEPGRDQETDAELRQRRLSELFARAQGPLAAIQAVVSRVSGVLSCRVYHNPSTFPVDSDGIPHKAFNVVLENNPTTPTSDQQQAIGLAIWSATGAGGESYGTDYSVVIVDSEGQNQTVRFDTVDVQDVVLEIDLVTSSSADPITPNIEDVVAERILEVAQASHESVGRDVRALDYQGIVYDMLAAGTISGVDGVTVRMAVSPGSPAAVAKLLIGIREKADFDSGNLTVAQV